MSFNFNPPQETYDPVEDKEEEVKPAGDGRDEWGSNIEFILSTIGTTLSILPLPTPLPSIQILERSLLRSYAITLPSYPMLTLPSAIPC